MRVDDLEYTLYVGENSERWIEEYAPILSLQIFTKTKYAVSALDIIIQDNMGVARTQYNLLDGSLLTLVYGNSGVLTTDKFRVYKVSKITVNNTPVLRIMAWEDRIPWFVDCNTGSFEGTSSELIRQLATDAGMKYDGDPTNDKQVWLGFGRKTHVYARESARHGYVDDNSIMELAVSRGLVRYKNLYAIDRTKPKAVFAYDVQPEVGGRLWMPVTDLQVQSNSGFANLMGGYGTKAIDLNVKEETTNSFDKVGLSPQSQPVQSNKTIRSKVKKQVKVQPIVSGNTHSNYSKAEYQNERGAGFFSERLLVVSIRQSNLQLLDPVTVQVGKKTQGNHSLDDYTGKSTDGEYLVDGRIIYIAGRTYSEMFILKREGQQRV